MRSMDQLKVLNNTYGLGEHAQSAKGKVGGVGRRKKAWFNVDCVGTTKYCKEWVTRILSVYAKWIESVRANNIKYVH